MSLISSPSLRTSSLLSSRPLWSGFPSSSHSSPILIQKLCRTAHAMAILTENLMSLSRRFCKILQRDLRHPKAHSILTLALDSSRFYCISLLSLVASGNGFWSHGDIGYALSPTKYGPISWWFTLTTGPLRTSPCSALWYKVLFRNMRVSCILPGFPVEKI